jgi:hypothetical protein
MKRIALLIAGLMAAAAVTATTVNIPLTVTVTPTQVTIAVAGQSTVVPVPVVAPPVIPPPTLGSSCNSQVVLSGKSTWTGNFNYGGSQEIDSATAPDGTLAMKILATTPMGTDGHAGGGGFQPFCQNPPNSLLVFNTTPFKYLVFVLMPTRAGQTWVSGFEGSGDVTIAGGGLTKSVESFGPAPQPNVWATYKVPLGVGGYNLPVGTQALKFNLQDNMTWGSMPQNALGNSYYIKDIHFSTSALFATPAADDGQWRLAA